jgi:hypothetical protein
MFRKVTLALAAAATLGAIALSPTAASAKPPLIWNPNPHFHQHHWHPGVALGFGLVTAGYAGCYQNRLVLTPFGHRMRTVNVCML